MIQFESWLIIHSESYQMVAFKIFSRIQFAVSLYSFLSIF